MVTRVIREASDADRLAAYVRAQPRLPLTVTIVRGDPRRDAQNRLSQRWYSDIARQLADMDREEVRADCKVTFGVPILTAENEAFRVQWAAGLGHLSYEAVRKFVQVTDQPVTRLMTVKQMTTFMDAMQRHWLPLGVRLTDPEALKYEEEFA